MGVAEIARSLGVSKSYVSRVKKEYTESLLRSRGEVEARVFELLDEGKDPVTIVKELKLPSNIVVEIYNRYLELKELPKITIFDLGDEVESLNEELHELKEAIGKLSFQLRKETEERLNSQYKAVSRDLSTLSMRIESLEKRTATLQGTTAVVVSLLGMPLITSFFQKLTLTPNGLNAVEREYIIAKEWAELAGVLWNAQGLTGKEHIFGRVMANVLDLAVVYRDVLKTQGNSQGARLFDEIIKLLKYGPSSGRPLSKNTQK